MIARAGGAATDWRLLLPSGSTHNHDPDIMPKALLLLLIPILVACSGSDDPAAQGRIETDISIASWDEEKVPPEGKANLVNLAKGDPEAEAIAQAALAKGEAMTVGQMRAAMKAIRDLRAKREATGKQAAAAK